MVEAHQPPNIVSDAGWAEKHPNARALSLGGNHLGFLLANSSGRPGLTLDTDAFLRLIKPAIAADQYATLERRLGQFALLSPDLLNGTGVTLREEQGTLVLVRDGVIPSASPRTGPGAVGSATSALSADYLGQRTPLALTLAFAVQENDEAQSGPDEAANPPELDSASQSGADDQTPSTEVLAEDAEPLPDALSRALDPDQALPQADDGGVEVVLPGGEPSAEPEAGTGGIDSNVPLGPHGRPDINPFDRDIDMTVPLTYLARTLGEIPILLTADDRLFLEAQGFVRLMASILNDPAYEELAGVLGEARQFERSDLEGSGVSLTYDPSTLAVVVVDVAPEKRATVNLFAPPREDKDQATLQPERLSAFLNLNVIQAYLWEDNDAPPPTLAIDGAVRVGSIVFEGDGQFSERLGSMGDSYRFTRNFARLVYDEPEKFRRWFAGDLDPEVRGQQSFVSMGGVGVVRQQRRFNGFRSAILQANRELVIQRESSVRFLRNGVLFRELRLQPGRYDFSQLPLLAGSNDIDIQVADNSGQIQNLSYQQYLDPIDLDPGDYEYGAYFGPTSETFAGAPDYQGPLAFTGFFRKAFFNRPALSIGLQASQEVQTVTSQIQFVLANGGRLLLDGGLSNSDVAGQGFAGGVSYEHFFTRDGFADTLTVRADFLSEDFSTLGNPDGINSTSATVSGQYTRQFTEEFIATADVSYVRGRLDTGDSYRLGVNGFYQLDRRWTFRAGVEYINLPGTSGGQSGINVTAGIVFQPSFRRRAEARYQSRNNLAELSYNQSGLNQLNTVGFGGILSRQDGSTLGQGFFGYSANRFDVGASHAAFGPNISSFGANNVSTVRVGTTMAFAGNQFGLGRRINDSFILLSAHPNLEGRSVVAGQSLAENNFIGRSGALGSAVNNFLGSYAMQTVQYDVEDPPLGYDTGPGVFRVYPSYKSGYAARIGTDAFVTAMGTFILAPDQPLALAGGRVTLLDVAEEDEVRPLPFFTNSVGRFAIANLLPGRRYLVETYGPNGTIAYTMEFSVPQDTDGLVRMGEVLPGSQN